MTTATQTPAGTVAEGHIDPAARLAAAAADVPVQTRSERPTSFDPADFGAPTGREVNWKHTPLDRIAALLRDEPADDEAITVTVTAAGAELGAPLREGQAPRGTVLVPEDLPSAIASRRADGAVHVRIPAEAELEAPVVVEVAGADAARRGILHLVIEAQAHARGTVLLRHTGAAALAENVEIVVADGAQLEVVTVQQWDDAAVHAASHQARVGRDGLLRHVVVSFGGGVVRVNPSVELAGTGSQGQLYGLSFADAGQHLESQVYLHHKGENTVGDVLYKGALQGASARSVWIGDVLIGPDATGTDSYEANRNLVLTDGARADSIPNLEIETGDIRGAGHASATGRFDDEQLFYLQARGIAEDEARRLVVLGFLTEIVQKIDIPALQDELIAAIEAELALTESAVEASA
ncbi:Fe-S cluster assembly protein SufD [Microbacterium aurum]|uniref:Fe-S cluster assembly protein SufD n=1 Tax=Microbacterium aurum TaxID=36805 RepID=UPI001EF3F5E0|nr:Fe-S cluster assembly protein SufD [Microbacterium aurum]MCG7414694.1 Fe-S cluster assembly protein SufD [Microbacterium aurum]